MRKLLKITLGGLCTLVLLLCIMLVGFRANAWLQEGSAAEALSPPNGRFVDTQKGRLHISEWGEAKTTPILMTHGMAAWGGLWSETAEELAKNGYRVIAVDQPPFGFSDRSNPDFSRSKQAERMKALVDALELKDYILLGHSYGGGVALETALRYPQNIKALVLVCPVINMESNQPIAKKSVPSLLQYPMVAETLVSASVTNPLLTGFLTKRFMHRKDALTDKHIEILQTPMALKGNTAHMVQWLQQFLAGDPNALSRTPKEIAKATMPVSFIWGEEDNVTPIAQGDELAVHLKPKQFNRLAGVGHMPQLEVPALFNTTLLDTLVEFKAAKKSELGEQRLHGTLKAKWNSL